MKTQLILLPVLIFLVLSCKTGTNKIEKKKYNVLFLIVDDMNDYGFYHNYALTKTPHLDNLKASSLTFRNAYCASPVCTPSRAATFSGLYPHISGAYFNGSDPWRNSDTLKKIETLPEYFMNNGYTTFGRGKTYHAALEKGRDKRNWNNKYWGGGFGPFADSAHAIRGKFWGMQSFPDSMFPDNINVEASIEFLAKDHEKPFFLALGLWRPHTPFTAPQRFFDMYDSTKTVLPEGYKKGDLDDVAKKALALVDPFKRFECCGDKNVDLWKKFIWGYNASTSFADWNIGRIVNALDSSKYADNTVVVFWSDNGYLCGEKNHWEKGVIWEQAALTPMLIRVPGSNSNGKVCTRTVNLVDLYSTLTELCGIEKPTHVMGNSLVPLLENPETEWNHPSLTTLGIEYSSVRDETYRYIRFDDGGEELYDHTNDPYEFNNLAGNPKYDDVKTELAKSIPKEWAPELKGRRN